MNEPTEPGFYKYSGGRQLLIFCLDNYKQWWAIFDVPSLQECTWAYIEQALGVWDLEKI